MPVLTNKSLDCLYKVDWDTDGLPVDLPNIIMIRKSVENKADWLSDHYGWCVNSVHELSEHELIHMVAYSDPDSPEVNAVYAADLLKGLGYSDQFIASECQRIWNEGKSNAH